MERGLARLVAALPLVVLVGCRTSSPRPSPSAQKIASYVVTDPCGQHADAPACAADPSCAWVARAAPCPAGTVCPAGGCLEKTCRGIPDPVLCAEMGCAWSAVSKLCPVGTDCAEGGFCHPIGTAGGGGCACLSPLYCPAGAACPTAECDCSGNGSAGTCSCTCPGCAPGEACPPCVCTCSTDSSGGCVRGGTCACTCSAAPSPFGTTASASACVCDCVPAGSVATGALGAVPTAPATVVSSCACPQCVGCPCDCPPPNPCTTYADLNTCQTDTADHCDWVAGALGCTSGTGCTGACREELWGTGPTEPIDRTGCACACPGGGISIEPPRGCACDCSGSPEGGCMPPPATSPSASPLFPAVQAF